MSDPVDPLRERAETNLRANTYGGTTCGQCAAILPLHRDACAVPVVRDLLADRASLQAERATFYEAYRRRCDEETKALTVRAEQAEARIRELEQAAEAIQMAAIKSHWFTQGGEHEFGDLFGTNADEIVAAILARVRHAVSQVVDGGMYPANDLADTLRAQLAAAEDREARVRQVERFLLDVSSDNPAFLEAATALQYALASTGQPADVLPLTRTDVSRLLGWWQDVPSTGTPEDDALVEKLYVFARSAEPQEPQP